MSKYQQHQHSHEYSNQNDNHQLPRYKRTKKLYDDENDMHYHKNSTFMKLLKLLLAAVIAIGVMYYMKYGTDLSHLKTLFD